MIFGCCECKIALDDYTRADADDPGDYTEVGGSDYDIASNELLCVTGGLLIHDTAHPGGPGAPQRLRFRFKRSSTSQVVRGVIAYADASNYLYAVVETLSSCDVLRLYQVVAGVATEVQDRQSLGSVGAVINEWHTIEICLQRNAGYYYQAGGADLFRAKVTLNTGFQYAITARAGDYGGGDKVGLDHSASVRTDDFYFGWAKDSGNGCKGVCPECKIDSACYLGTHSGADDACSWDSGTFLVRHPDDSTDHRVEAIFNIDDGEFAQVRLNAKRDATAYHFAKVTLAGTLLTLTIGKTSTTLATDTNNGALAGEYVLCAHYAGGTLYASVRPVLQTLAIAAAAAGSTAVADGYYTGRSGSVDWGSFSFIRGTIECGHCPSEPAPPCSRFCIEGETPSHILALFEDIQSQPSEADTCDCETLSDEGAICARSTADDDVIQCGWRYDNPDDNARCPHWTGVLIQIGQNAPLGGFIVVTATTIGTALGGAISLTFRLSGLTMPIDCLSIDGLEIPFLGETGVCQAGPNIKCKLYSL